MAAGLMIDAAGRVAAGRPGVEPVAAEGHDAVEQREGSGKRAAWVHGENAQKESIPTAR
jgi:hypothetical protein